MLVGAENPSQWKQPREKSVVYDRKESRQKCDYTVDWIIEGVMDGVSSESEYDNLLLIKCEPAD